MSFNPRPGLATGATLTNRVKPLQTKGGSDVSKSRDALRYRGFIGWK
jgi:hypothetical protein